MFRRLPTIIFVTAILFGSKLEPHPQSANPVVASTLLTREEQKAAVNGVSEVWRLEWKSSPKSICGPENLTLSVTCPCSGFAFGESGRLDLVRLANNREIDRLELSPLFEQLFSDQDGAVVQRWAVKEKDSSGVFVRNNEQNESGDFIKRVQSRPVVSIMHFADYNHDGKATEFFLQTSVEPCGKIMGVVVGLDGTHPRLHPFGTAAHSEKPLVMQKREWEELLHSTASIKVLDWRCGDHGSEIETELELSATSGIIHATRLEYECTEQGNRGRFLREQAL